MTSGREENTWQTDSPEATRALGEALGGCLIGGMVIGLSGPLGAGKTQLVKGMAAGNGDADPRKVTSPTFTLIHEHPGRLMLYHIDAYRLDRGADLIALGFDELVRPDAVVVVEWANRVQDALPADTLWIEVTPLGETVRRFSLAPSGDSAGRCIDALRQDYR